VGHTLRYRYTWEVTRSGPLAILLCLHASLLFFSLDLLPIWTDELFTVNTVSHPAREIVTIVQHDIHPPLYFLLLRQWQKLPLPWTGIAALRAFSGLWALLATFLLDQFWMRSWKPLSRWTALCFFALSPCLLLYSRMARSYSMQTALVLLSVGLFLLWTERPHSLGRACAALAAIVALLYTHYVPGLALLAGFVVTGWRSLRPLRLAAFVIATALAYFPWIVTLANALGRWGRASSFTANYTITGNALLEHVAKILFAAVSLTIGETFLALSLVLAPIILLLAVKGSRTPEFSRPLLALVAIAAAVGYLGVSRWASYPFIPARLLWLLPFLSLAVALGLASLNESRVRSAVAAAILLSYVSSYIMYFRRESFLNLGYNAPLPEIAATLNREAQPADIILLDTYNTDYQVLGSQLSGRTPAIALDSSNAVEARRRTAAARTVWVVRNTRDISPDHITTTVESEACAGRTTRNTMLEPYAPWQQTVLRIAGLRLTHFYQLTECSQPDPAH
jgi:uncharacterized membrane protein